MCERTAIVDRSMSVALYSGFRLLRQRTGADALTGALQFSVTVKATVKLGMNVVAP